MSLDVYLRRPGGNPQEELEGRIFIRRDGSTVEISRDEWDRLYPGREPVTFSGSTDSDYVYSANITHNLGRMAHAAGIYECLWRPEDSGITKAVQLIEPLEKGIELMVAEPERFRPLNAENGWGTYEQFVPWVRKYLDACKQYPDAEVSVSR